jgi:hypothetical protein
VGDLVDRGLIHWELIAKQGWRNARIRLERSARSDEGVASVHVELCVVALFLLPGGLPRRFVAAAIHAGGRPRCLPSPAADGVFDLFALLAEVGEHLQDVHS